MRWIDYRVWSSRGLSGLCRAGKVGEGAIDGETEVDHCYASQPHDYITSNRICRTLACVLQSHAGASGFRKAAPFRHFITIITVVPSALNHSCRRISACVLSPTTCSDFSSVIKPYTKYRLDLPPQLFKGVFGSLFKKLRTFGIPGN